MAGAFHLSAQSVIPVGPAGSYASYVPANNWYADAYYGLGAGQLEPFPSDTTPALYNYLHMSSSLIGQPIPTTHWWTDMLMANRSYLPAGSDQYVLEQDPYGGQMWFCPGMLQPQSYGFDAYFPNSWNPANAPSPGWPNGTPQGGFNTGPALQVHGDIPLYIPSDDIAIGCFSNGQYPPGTVLTGTGFGTAPIIDSGLSGVLGNYVADTRASNALTGTCTLPSFTVTKQYLNFLMCGGTYTGTYGTCVNLIVGGTTVLTASGLNSTNLSWYSWDISPWNGQTATVQIVDNQPGGWGFIACEQVVESDTNNMAGRFGGDFVATNTIVTNWGDWNVDFIMPDANGHQMNATMVRGVPFTWTTWEGGMNPKFIVSGTTTFYDINSNVIDTSGSSFVGGAFSFNYASGTTTRAYGVFLPPNTTVNVASGYVEPQLSGSNNYMVLAYLPATTNLAGFAPYAFARPTNTAISWNYDPAQGMVNTTWTITTAAMDSGTENQTIQGWLPHHYRTTANDLNFEPYTYLTPRGIMKCAPGNTFNLSFPFKGIAPVLPAPVVTGTVNDYQPERMELLMNEFNPGTMLGDTYWSGKALAICAQYMAWANQMGDTANYNRLKSALETAFTNWMTYTPGNEFYFAYYPNWHAMVGWDASYGSQAFNDMHFHYGYFAVAMATLGIYDQQFLANYGPMMKMIVKSYGNWERTDTTEPFLRQFDVWEGHNNAGGTSSPVGENEESSSEGIQGWGGMFLLGSVMNDGAMQAAGAMGFSMESCAINEYWQDIYQTNFPSVYGMAGNGQVWSTGLNYGTYFSGDPAWVYAIQYCPSNHWLNYLTRYNPSTVVSKYNQMWTERNNWCNSYPAWTSTNTYAPGVWVNYASSVYSLNGTATLPAGMPNPSVDTTDWSCQAVCTDSQPDCLGDSPGHVVLVYQALFEHDAAAAEFDNYWANNEPIATSAGDGGSSYYLIHAMREIGDQDFTCTTSIPTSAVYVNAVTGVRSVVVYNPQPTTQQAIVYASGVATGTMTIPAQVTVSTTNLSYTAAAPPVPSGFSATSGSGQVVLTWSSIPTATGYNVKRSTSLSGSYTLIASPASATCADTNGITNGGTYYYMVSSSNSAGQSSYSTPYTVSVAPLAPVLTGTLNNGDPVLSWNNPGGATMYSVMRGTQTGGPYTTISGSTTALTFTDTTTAAGMTYYYVVTALDAGGQSANSNELLMNTVTPPSPPASLTVILGNEQVSLAWGASAGATSYNVKRATVSGGPYTTITSSTTASFTDTNVTNGLTYFYVVSAVGSGGESANSSQVTQWVLAPPVFAVDCGSTDTGVGLFVTDTDYLGGETGANATAIDTSAVYDPAPMAVYQSFRQDPSFSYVIPGLAPNTCYDVRLHFAEIWWTGAGGRLFNVTINQNQVLTDFDIFATSGTIFKANIQEFTTISSGSAGQYTIAFSASKDNALINGIEIRILRPTAPSGLTVTSGSAQATLNWSSLNLSGSPTNATSYNIKRAAVSGGPYTVIGSSTNTSFTDTTVAGSAPYYYVVSSVDAGGESANSGQVTAMPLTPLQQWRMSFFGTINSADPVAGDTGMPQLDGVPNLMKYAIGLSPLKPAARSALPFAGTSGGYLDLTFTRVQSDTDITYHVQVTNDLSTWTEVWNSASNPYSGAGATQAVTVQDTVPMSSAPNHHRFIRLEVTNP